MLTVFDEQLLSLFFSALSFIDVVGTFLDKSGEQYNLLDKLVLSFLAESVSVVKLLISVS